MALTWEGYRRNKQEVVKRLKQGRYEMITGNGVGLMDRFFAFMREIDSLDVVEEVEGEGYERVMIPMAKLLLTYQSKILLGIAHMNQVPDLLFNELGVLKLIGFTLLPARSGKGTVSVEKGSGRDRFTRIPWLMLSRDSRPKRWRISSTERSTCRRKQDSFVANGSR